LCYIILFGCRKAGKTREENADDIWKLIEFFRYCHEQNPQFYWDVDCDKDGYIKNMFWSHASMQGDYADFGANDAMTFDTTYKTNAYEMPLAMFVGSNHHNQNAIFGCALLRHETIDAFRWLFGTFKRCMGGKTPRCILTGKNLASSLILHAIFCSFIDRIICFRVKI
jgi:hypothetical protein